MLEQIRGAKGGGKGDKKGSARTPIEHANTLRSASTARIIDLLGEGPIVGLVDGLKSVFLDDTPLQNADGTFNFQGVTITERTGEANQSRIPGFPSVEHEVDVSTQVKYDMPIVRTVSNLEADAVRIKIRVPALTNQNTTTGDISGSGVDLAVDVQSNGGVWIQRAVINIQGKTTSPYERQMRVDLSDLGPWNIRVRRLTSDSGSSTVQNDSFWAGYTEIVDARLTYPDSALIGLEVDARQFGTDIPSRSFDVKGRIIRVPSNYDPATRTYSGLWDGTFQQAWSDNPAWVYLDLATHPRYGAGLQNVDKWSLYQIARYCDELVPNGYGAMEPRFTVNTVLAEQVEAIAGLNQLASAFRGMTYWGTNTAMAVADMPSDPVKLVSPANVINGDFESSGTGLRDRHSVAVVTWNDPEDGYKKQVEIVEDPDAIRQFGWRQVDVTAFGCTSRGQAHRLGRWLLYSERAETETISYTAGVDHADLRPGDIIAVSDPAWAGARLSGRVRVPGTSSLTLDSVPDVVAGSDWFLDVMLPAGTIERRQVSVFNGNTVSLIEPLSAEPITAAMWVLSSLRVEPKLFRVVSVSEKGGALYSVTAAEHDPDKYARVELGLNLPERDTSLITGGPLPSPSSITAEEYLYRSVAVQSGASLSITPPNDPRISLYEFQVWGPDADDYSTLAIQSDVTADLQNTAPGEYKIRVRSLSVTGLRSPWCMETVSLQGLLRPPADITDLRLTVNAGQLTLWWPPVPDLDLDHYEVRYSPALAGVSWASAQTVVDRVSAGSNRVMLPARRGTYLVRAVDTSGIYSLNAVSGTSEIADLDSYNAVEVVDEGPSWAGERVGVSSSGGQLQLDSRDPIASWKKLADVVTMTYGSSGLLEEGWYYAAEVVDLGHVYASRITSEVLAFGYDILKTIRSWETLSSIDRLTETDPGQWGLTLEISQSTTPQPAAPTDWTPWVPLTIGEYTARAFRFRLHLRSLAPAVTPSVSLMRIIIDMPDRVADGQDLLCPPGGARFTFEPAFMARPSLAVDAQGLSVGDRKSITSIDDKGFTIQFFDSTGLSVGRTFDYLAKGYGRRVTH